MQNIVFEFVEDNLESYIEKKVKAGKSIPELEIKVPLFQDLEIRLPADQWIEKYPCKECCPSRSQTWKCPTFKARGNQDLWLWKQQSHWSKWEKHPLYRLKVLQGSWTDFVLDKVLNCYRYLGNWLHFGGVSDSNPALSWKKWGRPTILDS